MYHIEATNSGGYSFKVRSKDDSFIIDASGKGMTPLDALLSGLASCIGVYVRKYLDGAKLPVKEFSVIADAQLIDQPLLCFKKIGIKIDFKGQALDERRAQALIAFVKNCPAHNTLKNSPDIEIKIE